jgi:hypothetical protein
MISVLVALLGIQLTLTCLMYGLYKINETLHRILNKK